LEVTGDVASGLMLRKVNSPKNPNKMEPQQVVLFTAEQRLLHRLLRDAVDYVQFIPQERCAQALALLAPMMEAALNASDALPVGLEDKRGRELLGMIKQHCPEPTTTNNTPSKTPSKRSREEGDHTPAVAAAAPKIVRKLPARKQHKQSEDDDHDEEELEEATPAWNYATHSNVASVTRAGHHGKDGAFGLFIEARPSGQGRTKPEPVFADGASLVAVDRIEARKKRRRVVEALSQGVRRLFVGDEGPLQSELVDLLQPCQWAKDVLKEQGEGDDGDEGDDSKEKDDE
jgi:hypothetical protein